MYSKLHKSRGLFVTPDGLQPNAPALRLDFEQAIFRP